MLESNIDHIYIYIERERQTDRERERGTDRQTDRERDLYLISTHIMQIMLDLVI